ncbi:MAG: RNA recognition motif domain-containing protein [Thermoguttaceae bacterium]
MKIYVGNLAYRTTEDDLRNVFGRFGTVDAVDIISDRETGRSKGFGFVEMGNADEAQAAIEATDGQELGERTLKVNEARPRTPRTGGGGGGGGRFRGAGGGRGDGGGYRNRY